MADKNTCQVYALFHGVESAGPTDQACLHRARLLADGANSVPHALVVASEHNADAAVDAAQRAGIQTISLIRHDAGGAPLQPHQLAELFASLVESIDAPPLQNAILLVSAGTLAEEAAGAIAAQTGAVPVGRPTDLAFDAEGALKITRSAYGGRLMIEQRGAQGLCIAAVRTSKSSPASIDDAVATGATVRTVAHRPSQAAYPVSQGAEAQSEASLEGARLIVSGGRGMAGETGFRVLKDLAKKLGGAVGSSLPAIDAGWAPVSRQVGQSGKYVSPETYIAVGISGTPQHLAGVDPHTAIIAINKDPEAPIFRVARLGVVADWEEFVPALIEEVNMRNTATSI